MFSFSIGRILKWPNFTYSTLSRRMTFFKVLLYLCLVINYKRYIIVSQQLKDYVGWNTKINFNCNSFFSQGDDFIIINNFYTYEIKSFFFCDFDLLDRFNILHLKETQKVIYWIFFIVLKWNQI